MSPAAASSSTIEIEKQKIIKHGNLDHFHIKHIPELHLKKAFTHLNSWLIGGKQNIVVGGAGGSDIQVKAFQNINLYEMPEFNILES